jgi:large subunit ribosomal protein L25
VDVEGMDIGDAVHASDLKLPPGVTLQVEPDTLVLHVIAQQAAEEPEAAEGEGEGEVPESVDSVADESRDGEEESAG